MYFSLFNTINGVIKIIYSVAKNYFKKFKTNYFLNYRFIFFCFILNMIIFLYIFLI